MGDPVGLGECVAFWHNKVHMFFLTNLAPTRAHYTHKTPPVY